MVQVQTLQRIVLKTGTGTDPSKAIVLKMGTGTDPEIDWRGSRYIQVKTLKTVGRKMPKIGEKMGTPTLL